MPSVNKRLLWVDAVRGFAIILMVIFHFCYDLKYFANLEGFSELYKFARQWTVPNGEGWREFRFVILTLFIFTVGLSLSLAHGNAIRWKHFAKRLAWLVIAALGITIMSLFVFPEGWIYFGILHFIVFASLIGLLFLRIPILACLAGALILLGYWLGFLPSYWPFHYISDALPSYTEDYVPIFPWIGIALLGVGLAGLAPIRKIDIPPVRIATWLAFLGRHGLIIYVIHQPLLFGAFFVFGSLI